MMGLIFFFSSQTADESAALSDALSLLLRWGINLPLRKVAHFSEFGLLAVLFFISLYVTDKKKMHPFYTFMLTFLYACTDELHQIFVDGRGNSFKDVLIDSAGGVAGIIFIMIIITLCVKSKERKIAGRGK